MGKCVRYQKSCWSSAHGSLQSFWLHSSWYSYCKIACLWLGKNSFTFFYSYSKRRKENVKINNTYSLFKILLSGVPQGSILGPILLNISINDLFFSLSTANLRNFADNSTISAFSKDLQELKTQRQIPDFLVFGACL